MNIFVKVGRLMLGGILFAALNGYSQEKSANPCLKAMSQQERNELQQPENGTLVLNTTTGCINYYVSGNWKEYCEKISNTPVTGTVVFDTINGDFKVYNGQRWIPLDTFSEHFKMLMTVKPDIVEEEITTPENKTTASKPTNEQAGNGEIIAERPEPIPTPDGCHAPPSIARAGKDLVSTEALKLEANEPEHGIGKWLIVKGEGGELKNLNDPHTEFNGVQGTTYTLLWEISTKCDTTFDEVLVRIRFPCEPEPSQSHAGIDQHNVEVCYLNASLPKSGTGSWSIVYGEDGQVAEAENPNSLFTGMPGVTYILRWTVKTKCGFTQDDVRVTLKPPCKPKPSLANAGEDQLEVLACQLNGNKPEFGSGKWYIISGKGGKLINPALHNSQFEGQPEEKYLLKWVISTECGKSEDGVIVTFRKGCPEEFTDIRDGKKYKAILIGEQCWMAENLNYQGTEYFCYEDFPANCEDMGALYRWEPAMDYSKKEKSRGACPEGWHVPSDKEWEDLMKAPGIDAKELSTKGNSGFDLIFGGTRYPNGRFFNKKEYAFYWSSTSDGKVAWNRYFHAEGNEAEHYSTDIENGFSVRCVQD